MTRDPALEEAILHPDLRHINFFNGRLLTGGDISPDGKRVIICDYFDGYELVLPEKAKDFEEIWKQDLKIVPLGKREQGEAVTYAPDGRALFATSEKKNQPLVRVDRVTD